LMRGLGSKKVKKNSFFEKKEQKTFAYWPWDVTTCGSTGKSFLVLFFKKELLPYGVNLNTVPQPC
jgi:hypothetical protein